MIKNQLTKCGTSVGANYREANRSRSKNEFKSRIKICESEASETQYWLELIVKAELIIWDDVKSEYDEASELLAIFTSISKGLKSP